MGCLKQPRSAVRERRIADAVAKAAASRTRDEVLLRELRAGRRPGEAERLADQMAQKEVRARAAAAAAAARAAAEQAAPSKPNFRAPGAQGHEGGYGGGAVDAVSGRQTRDVLGFDGGTPMGLPPATARSRPDTGTSETQRPKSTAAGNAQHPSKDDKIAALEKQLGKVTELLAGGANVGHAGQAPPYGAPPPPHAAAYAPPPYGYPLPHPMGMGMYGYPPMPPPPYGYPYAPPVPPAGGAPSQYPQHAPQARAHPPPQEGGAAAAAPPPRARSAERPTTGVSPLPEALARDDEMRRAHEQHVREMTRLKQQLERERREGELEKMRVERASIAGSVHGGGSVMLDPTPRSDFGLAGQRERRAGSHNEALSTGRRSVGGVDVSPKSAGGRSSRRHTPAPPSHDGDRFERPLEALPEGDGSSGSEYEPDLFNVALRVRSLGPISIAGGARVKASLYKGYVPDDDDDARGETRVASGEMASAPGMHVFEFDEDVIEMNAVEVGDATNLVFEVVWQRRTDATGATREETIAWAWAPLLDGSSSKAKAGVQSVAVHRLPLLLHADKHLPFDGALLEFLVEMEQVEDSDDDDEHGGLMGARGDEVAEEAIEQRAEDVPGVPRAAWMRVRQGAPQNRPFQLGESLVIYVDAARFMPRNATVVQATAAVYTTSFEKLTPVWRGVAQMGSNALHPVFDLRCICQTSEWPDDIPQATLLVQLETVERPSVLHPAQPKSGKVSVVGYAAINLFVSRESAEEFERRDQPPEGARGYVLNEGAFQLTLHTSLPHVVQGFSSREVRSFPRVPCASALVRITSRASDAAADPLPPRFEDALYSSAYADPDAIERRVFARRLEWPAPAVREEAAGLAGAYGLVASGDVDVASDEQLAVFSEGVLQPEGGGNVQPLDYRLAAEYVHSLGVVVGVDGVLNVAVGNVDEDGGGKGFFGSFADFVSKASHCTAVVHSLSPPGGLYSDDIAATTSADQRLLETVTMTKRIESQSTSQNPRFNDGVVYHAGVGFDPRLVLIVDVRRIDHVLNDKKRAVVSYGWSFVNVFCDPDVDREGDEFVASDHYILPLFHGAVPTALVAALQHARGPIEMAHVIRTAVRDKRLHFAEAAAVVRMADAQRAAEFSIPAFNDSLSLPMWLEPDLARLYKGPRTGVVPPKEDRSMTFKEIAEKAEVTVTHLNKEASKAASRAVGLVDGPPPKPETRKSAK